MTEAVPPIVSYHSKNNKPEWFAYIKFEGSKDVFGVRFEGATEDDAVTRAKDWWINERSRQVRIVGRSELGPDEVDSKPYKQPETGWGNPVDSWGSPANVSDHGMAGKVWLINHSKQERKRVDPVEVDGLIASGWEKAGPKTAFRVG